MVDRPDNVEPVETGDGSHTLVDRDRGVRYSSMHGAVDESRHIFVEGCRIDDHPPPLHILELGFGAGINFVQTVRRIGHLGNETSDRLIDYRAVDYAPVSPDDLPFHDGPEGRLVREALAETDGDGEPARVVGFDGRVSLRVYPIAWSDLDLDGWTAHAVYFDPFGPRNEPNSWTEECFAVARRHMTETAVLGTYSAATDVKRAMFAAGLQVASAPGPGPKREITYAARSVEPIADRDLLDRDEYVDNP